MKNSNCVMLKFFNEIGRHRRCGKMNKKREHAETEEGRKVRMSTISDKHCQKATGCAPPKRCRIEPDPEKDVNPELLNVPREP